MKLLLVGDVHAKVSNLDDCEALLKHVQMTAIETSPDYVVFLGDQYDTHAIVNVEVQAFWMRWFETIEYDKIALIGNHDMPGSGNTRANAMQVHKSKVFVVGDEGFRIKDILFLGYCQDPKQFLDVAQSYGPTTRHLVCHQTFDGAQYENGFYAKEALDPNAVPQHCIVSGHIHTPAFFGKVLYPGSPRWQTVSDANIARNIVLWDTDTGVFRNFATGDVCQKIWVLDDVEGQPLPPDFSKPGDRTIVNLHGTLDYVKARQAVWARPGLQVRSFPVVPKRAAVSESEGIQTSWHKWIEAYTPKYIPKGDLISKLVGDFNG